jgi:hypothetical protein
VTVSDSLSELRAAGVALSNGVLPARGERPKGPPSGFQNPPETSAADFTGTWRVLRPRISQRGSSPAWVLRRGPPRVLCGSFAVVMPRGAFLPTPPASPSGQWPAYDPARLPALRWATRLTFSERPGRAARRVQVGVIIVTTTLSRRATGFIPNLGWAHTAWRIRSTQAVTTRE